MSQLVFLLEEPSMKELLNGFLPRLIPGVEFLLVPHEGKSDLEQSIPRKLKAWRRPGARFIIVRDQDAADCSAVKARLAQVAASSGRTCFRIRVACRCLEAWILGDLEALATAFTGRESARKQLRGNCAIRIDWGTRWESSAGWCLAIRRPRGHARFLCISMPLAARPTASVSSPRQ